MNAIDSLNRLNIFLTRKELIKVGFWTFFILVIVFSPQLFGWLMAPAGQVYADNLLGEWYDANAYRSFIRQAVEGDWFFKIKYTTEPHSSWYTHPVFLIMGLTTYYLKIPKAVVWHFTQALSLIIFSYSLYFFISYFIAKKEVRFFIYILTYLAGGLGFLLYLFVFVFKFQGSHSLSALLCSFFDVSIDEAAIAGSLFWPFLHALSLSLIIWIFILILEMTRAGSYKLALLAGFLGLVLSLIHYYDMPTVWLVSTIYLGFFYQFKYWKQYLIFFIISFLPIFYHLSVLRIDVFRAQANYLMLTPQPLLVILGFSPLIFLTISGIIYILFKKKKNFYFLVVWVVLIPFLIYLPSTFQRKLILGAIVPIGIIGFWFLNLIWQKLKTAKFFLKLFLRPLIIIFIIINFSTFFLCNYLLWREVLSLQFPLYLSQEIVDSFRWLEKNTSRDQSIMTSYEMGNFIPVYSGNFSFVGHSPQTKNFKEKAYKEKDFYNLEKSLNDSERINFLKQYYLDYVFLSEFESGKTNFLTLKNYFLSRNYLKLVYENQKTVIFKFISLP